MDKPKINEHKVDKCMHLWKIYSKCLTYKYDFQCILELDKFAKCRKEELVNIKN